MKPVAVFRHVPTEGPGYFATVLDRDHVPWRVIKVDAGEAVPADPRAFSGLAFMGGPMSVNDDLPWIAPVLRLIRAAVQEGVPVLGHCLWLSLASSMQHPQSAVNLKSLPAYIPGICTMKASNTFSTISNKCLQ